MNVFNKRMDAVVSIFRNIDAHKKLMAYLDSACFKGLIYQFLDQQLTALMSSSRKPKVGSTHLLGVSLT